MFVIGASAFPQNGGYNPTGTVGALTFHALDAIKTMVDSVQTITPKIPAVDLPFAEKLPKPHDVVASGYDFAEKLLTSQRKFADEVVKAAAPLMPGKGESK